MTCRTCNGSGALWRQQIIGGGDEVKPCPSCAADGPFTSQITYRSGVLIWRVSGVRGTSPNESRRYGSWRGHYRDRERWRMILAVSQGTVPVTPYAGVEVVACEWSKARGRGRDLDNIAASLKWPLDALVHAGYLAGDGPGIVQRLCIERPAVRPSWCPAQGLEVMVIPCQSARP